MWPLNSTVKLELFGVVFVLLLLCFWWSYSTESLSQLVSFFIIVHEIFRAAAACQLVRV